ncbi:HBR377Wp [Eremothecium sinecaudum]|uniref:non-specific serine/threonine protein kinase n=1 Tax=Eremothecium sinecaudum TaxID=45286 RepID=A0A109UXD1_9SACH|nr:HBR377Wp [Eremothecium sinecaudum]AMD19278.1 HBR377Wp [Eremothecium sinecaudum]
MNFSQFAPIPQIKSLDLGETIGQGTFGFVKSAALKGDDKVIIAVKFVHIATSRANGMTDDDITREAVIHSKCSKNRNVLRVIDCDISKDYLWIAMEMADGGDLFDKIEPDVGVDADVAQFYYQQLVRAVEYLHVECGVAHRDIKPENILLDREGNLKVADFGLASQFRRKDGTKRVSRDKRGSPPYMAPEIIYSDGYYADDTDIWSIGVLLFVLLTGETPWSLPSEEDDYFRQFLMDGGNSNNGPWAKINLVELNLLRKILQPNPRKRAKLDQLRQHPWFKNRVAFANEDGVCTDPELLAKKLLCNMKVSLSDDDYISSTQEPLYNEPVQKFMATQPVANELAYLQHDSLHNGGHAFSQKSFTQNTAAKDVSLNSKYLGLAMLQFQDSSLHLPTLNFNPNKLTKFFSMEDISIILPLLESALHQSGVPVKPDLYKTFTDLRQVLGDDNVYPLSIDIKARDRKGWTLSGTICIIETAEKMKVISFGRRNGDPLEWRRLFKRITIICRAIVYTQ